MIGLIGQLRRKPTNKIQMWASLPHTCTAKEAPSYPLMTIFSGALWIAQTCLDTTTRAEPLSFLNDPLPLPGCKSERMSGHGRALSVSKVENELSLACLILSFPTRAPVFSSD